MENGPPGAAWGAAEDARRAGQSGGSSASDMDISVAPGDSPALSSGLSLDALASGLARASGGTASDDGSGSARVASASQQRRRGRGRSLRSLPIPDGAVIVHCQRHGACSLVVGRSQGMPRASWACQSPGCQYRRPANAATRRLLPVRDGGTPAGGVHSPFPEEDEEEEEEPARPAGATAALNSEAASNAAAAHPPEVGDGGRDAAAAAPAQATRSAQASSSAQAAASYYSAIERH